MHYHIPLKKGGSPITRKVSVLLTLVLVSMLFIMPKNSPLHSVFRLSETPMIITKGHYGYSYMLEISFSHESLLPWLSQLEEPLPLLLLDSKWIQRSPNEIQFIQEKQFPVGLLGQNGEDYENLQQLQKEIAIFEQTFSNKPLWFATRDYALTDEMQKYLYAEEINVLAPSVIWKPDREDLKLSEGMIVSIPFHEETVVDLEAINMFLHDYDFLTIEENLFGYKMKTKSSP